MTTDSTNQSTGGDPLASLYHMSKTAGMATSEYQAVNIPSVVALILGALSFVANFELVLLVIPLVALILGIVAVYQIKTSNGTQTGWLLAIGGIVLALGFGAWAATGQMREVGRTRDDRQAVTDLITRLGENVRDGKFADAYQLFSPGFHERHKLADFETLWTAVKNQRALGNVKAMRSNNLFDFDVDANSNLRVAYSQMIIQYESGQESRPSIVFVYRDGQWKIEQLPDFFDPLPPDQRRTAPTT